jgi:hypothetical protein
MHSLRAGVIYFLLVFAVGWILDPIQEIWLILRRGRMTATLVEGVIIAIAMVVAARWVMRRYNVPPRLGPQILTGLVALGILLRPRLQVRCVCAGSRFMSTWRASQLCRASSPR